jgi:RNA recognition motif-containing protein
VAGEVADLASTDSDDSSDEDEPTSTLWIGLIPSSITIQNIQRIFHRYGIIVSARVLRHKNCAFVTFKRAESAIAAKAELNRKEVFPGAGLTRIRFAEQPSPAMTPDVGGASPIQSQSTEMQREREEVTDDVGENVTGYNGMQSRRRQVHNTFVRGSRPVFETDDSSDEDGEQSKEGKTFESYRLK